jgi:hypothetical protein
MPMPDLNHGQSDQHPGSLRLPRWVVDDRFDAAMAGSASGGWSDELPATGLRALAIPLVAIGSWMMILWAVGRIW